MDLRDRLQVFSEKLGQQLTVSVGNNGAMLCADGVSNITAGEMWMDGYWSDGGGSWDHNAWSDHY